MNKIRVDTNGSPLSRHWRIYLDGKDVSEFVTGINISGDIHSVPRVTLYCVGELEFPNELHALVAVLPENNVDLFVRE